MYSIIFFKIISKSDYEKLEGKAKSSVVKRKNPEEYFRVLFSERTVQVTLKIRDKFQLKPIRINDYNNDWK